MTRLLPLVLLLALAACGDDGEALQTASGTELVVETRAEPGAEPVRRTLRCDPAGGDHPDPAAACGLLARSPELLEPLPADLLCIEIYGGPQTGRVTGTVQGRPVDLPLSRSDGCTSGRWDDLVPLVPAGG